MEDNKCPSCRAVVNTQWAYVYRILFANTDMFYPTRTSPSENRIHVLSFLPDSLLCQTLGTSVSTWPSDPALHPNGWTCPTLLPWTCLTLGLWLRWLPPLLPVKIQIFLPGLNQPLALMWCVLHFFPREEQVTHPLASISTLVFFFVTAFVMLTE